MEKQRKIEDAQARERQEENREIRKVRKTEDVLSSNPRQWLLERVLSIVNGLVSG